MREKEGAKHRRGKVRIGLIQKANPMGQVAWEANAQGGSWGLLRRRGTTKNIGGEEKIGHKNILF